jgi:hypothetical protein
LATVRASGRGFSPIEDDFFAREAEIYEASRTLGDDFVTSDVEDPRRSRRPLMIGASTIIAVAALVGVVRFQPQLLRVQAVTKLWHETRGEGPSTSASLMQPASTSRSLSPAKIVEPPRDATRAETTSPPPEPEREAAPAAEGPGPAPRRASQSSSKFASAISKCRVESSGNHVRRALDACRKAVKLQPRSSEALTLLAHAEIDRHHSREAVHLATAAISADPQFTDAYFMMGKARQQEGQRAQARASYRQYLALAPHGHYAGEVRTVLSRGL